MNRLKIVIVILLGIVSFFACEKDDICVDGDTPLLVIRFYDIDNPEVMKPVPGLRIIGIDKDSPVDTFSDRISTLDSIGIPLNSGASSSAFSFIMNSAGDINADTGNTDLLTINYDLGEQFISRACGFVANYNNITTDFTASTENWIQDIEIVKDTVIFSTTITAHVKIFH